MDANEKALLRNTLVTLAGVCALLSLASCDSFLVPKCDFYADQQECSNPPEKDGSANPVGQPDPPPPPGIQISEPSFAWAAKIPLSNTIKYVGMSQAQAITWHNDSSPFYLKSWVLKLDVLNNNMDEVVGQACTTCANLANLADTIFSEDQIYIAGGSYWKLKYHNDYKLVYFDTNSKMAIDGVAIGKSKIPRAFFNPLKNSFVIEVDQAPGLSSSGVAIFQNGTSVLPIENNTGPPTAFVLGDLDAIDKKNQLDEIVLFSGATPLLIARQTSDLMYRYDYGLLSALKNAIYDQSAMIDAAFIVDLNNDGLMEFVYIRKGFAFIVTYIGGYQFQNWQKKIPLMETSGETIRSLSAVDITKDNFPELVVETDKAVHFYVNQPK